MVAKTSLGNLDEFVQAETNAEVARTNIKGGYILVACIIIGTATDPLFWKYSKNENPKGPYPFSLPFVHFAGAVTYFFVALLQA